MNFSVSNVAPTVGTVTCTFQTPSEAVDYNVTCNASITDTNGWQDVVACNATWFKATSLVGGAANENNKYYNATGCTLTSGTSNTVNCNCGFRVRYFADGSVNWIGNITARDSSNGLGRAESALQSLTVCRALDLTRSTVQWGSLAPGYAGTWFNITNITVANNTGNVNISFQFTGATADMPCSPSPANNALAKIKYCAAIGATGTAYASCGMVLTQTQTGSDIAGGWAKNRQGATPATIENRTIFWAVATDSGINGTCVITVNQYAVQANPEM